MRTGGESWSCSAWRREGSGETLLQPFDMQSGLKKMERDLLQGLVVTGQGATVLS